MIPIELQSRLIERMEKLFKHFRVEDEEKYIALNIYPQDLPEKTDHDEEHYPYVIVKLVTGSDEEENSPHQVRVLFIVGVFDHDNKYRGYKYVATIMSKIYQDLKRLRVVGDRFELVYPINWVIHEEDTHPYFFGGIETYWEAPQPLREDVEELI